MICVRRVVIGKEKRNGSMTWTETTVNTANYRRMNEEIIDVMLKYKLSEAYGKCVAEPLPEELTTENVEKDKAERARGAAAAKKAGALSQADIRQERANAIENMTESEHKVFIEERKARSNALKQALGISSLPLATRNAVESYLDGGETLEWRQVS